MSTPVFNPIYLVDALGEYARIPDGAILNIGGVVGPNFTVGNKPLLFADGTSTDGSPVNSNAPDFQTIYGNSVGTAFIDFTSGKDFILQAVNDNQFVFDADTGLVTITGDLHVLGEVTSVITSSVVTDRVIVNQTAGNYVPFYMEPIDGVTPVSDVVSIRISNGGIPVFSINAAGTTSVQDLLVVGTINGIDLADLQQDLTDHTDLTSTDIKHKASQISVDNSTLSPITGDNVQEALESIATSIANLTSIASVRGYEHTQLIAQTTWAIAHGQNTRRVQVSIWDSSDESIQPDSIVITSNNLITITYNTPVAGRAILMMF